MNCHTGDLVRYVGANINQRPNVSGWIGVAVDYVSDDLGHQCWLVRPALPGGEIRNKWTMSNGQLVVDEELRPIRETPGDDETLLWAPVPGKLIPV